jgi:hydroxymethylbilane synthase
VSRDNLTLDRLAAGARVGTSSPRRTARLRARRPDLVVVDLRGNVDSRIEKVRSGLLDAAVLAVAGLVRLGRGGEIDEVIDMATMLPAPGQGALTIECRDTDVTLLSALAFLDDDDSHVRTTAERAVLSAVGATCASAVGAYAVRDAGVLTLTADVSGADPGQHVVHTHSITLRGDDSDRENARRLGAAVGAALLDAGAAAFVNPGVDRD